MDDFFGKVVMINEQVRCIDEKFNKEFEENPYIQSQIRVLKRIHEDQSADNKGQDYGL